MGSGDLRGDVEAQPKALLVGPDRAARERAKQTVERGRRYVATDADGEPIGSYRSLDQAMGAVIKQCPSARAAMPS